MKTYLGTTGLDATWQEDFKKTVKCHKCRKTARIMFVAMEDGTDKEYIADLHPNTGAKKNGKFWVHDAIAVALYLCEKCFEVTTELNQA